MKFIKNKNLKKCSTFCIGGMVECFFETSNISEILKAIKKAESQRMKWNIFGAGSNILFPDKKVKGLLIRFRGGSIKKKKDEIIVSAGVSLSRLVDFSIKNSLVGLETLSGIPGTVGGAVFGNAGAYGKLISENISRVEIFEKGERKWISKRTCRFSYRNSIFKEKKCVILRIAFKLKKGNRKKLEKNSKGIIEIRFKLYPPKLKCPGSFFKNPLVSEISKLAFKKIDKSKIIKGKIPAGYLLESVEAKGMRVGDIKVADYHGNLFLNLGSGTRGDVEKLTNILKKRVNKKFGIILHEEVMIW